MFLFLSSFSINQVNKTCFKSLKVDMLRRQFSLKQESIEALFWLDHKMSIMYANENKASKKLFKKTNNYIFAPRIPERMLQKYCEESGITGIQMMAKYGHKTKNSKFLRNIINNIDEKHRNVSVQSPVEQNEQNEFDNLSTLKQTNSLLEEKDVLHGGSKSLKTTKKSREMKYFALRTGIDHDDK